MSARRYEILLILSGLILKTALALHGTPLQRPRVTLLMYGYVLFPDQSQRKASGIEVQLVRGGTGQFVFSVKTEEQGRFSFPQSLQVEWGNQLPGAPDTLYLYINIDGYSPVLQVAKLGANIVGLTQGPSEPNILPTEYDAPPLTRLEALRKELVAQYSELAVREYEAGLRESVKNKAESAISHYAKAVRYAPEFYDAFLQLGFAHKELKHADEAEKAFRRSLEIRPNSGQALTALGGILLDKGAANPAAGVYEEAEKILQEAVARTPWSSEALYFLGSAQFKISRLEEAESTLRQALLRDEPRHDARLMLVNVFMKQRRYAEALEQLTAYLEAVPNSPQGSAVQQLRTQIQSALKPPGR